MLKYCSFSSDTSSSVIASAPVVVPVTAQVPTVQAVPVVVAKQVHSIVSSAPVAAVQPVVSSAPIAAVQPVVASAPVAAVQPVVTSAVPADLTNSQFHAQDDIGQYNYGYSSPTSTKQELEVKE